MEREDIKKKLSNREIYFKDIPYEFRDDEEIALIAIEVAYNSFVCEYIGDTLKNNKEFAKKALRKYGDSIKYFSDEIKNDFECCKIATQNYGYTYIGKEMQKNKELALIELKRCCWDVKYVDKELRKDEDIIKQYWKTMNCTDSDWYHDICSVISIDEYGNNIIDEFLKIEKERHTEERINEYEENTEEVQFVKYENGSFNKQLMKEKFKPFVIIIGKKKNELVDDLIKRYDTDDRLINIIEVYQENVDTLNMKLITKDKENVFALLRLITYTTAGDTPLTEDNLGDIRCWFNKKNCCNKSLNVIKVNENEINDELKLEENEIYSIQLACKKQGSVANYYDIAKKIERIIGEDKNIDLHLHTSCNIDNAEFYILGVE